jgi:beta-xylosidase
MVWTTGWADRGIGLAHSRDLLDWSSQEWLPVMEHEPLARNCWAPEIVFHAPSKEFLLFWSSTIPGRFPETHEKEGDAMPGGGTWNHRIYFTTTRDFKAFAPSKLLYDPGFNCIDATIVPAEGRWLMFVKDETKTPVAKKNIRMAWADQPAGPWSPAADPISPDWVEGPTALRVGDAWHLYYDAYTRRRFEGLTSTDLKTWAPLDNHLAFPKGIRHGTAFAVPPEIVEALRARAP